jgi:hypothetical protein
MYWILLFAILAVFEVWIVPKIKYRLEQRRLANRWKENADPFTGAP